MLCPQCQQERVRCRCAGDSQARLLAPPPAWRRELQERVEAYRVRHHTPAPPRPPHPAARRVLTFRPGAAPAAAILEAPPIRSQAIALEEPLADPVPAPRPVPAPVALPAPVAATAPQSAAAPLVRPDPWTSRRAQPDDACLQLPLPMAAAAAPVALAPLPCTPAAPWLRLRAGGTDAAIVLAAAALFALTGWITLGLPALRLSAWKPWLPALVGVPAVLGALYLLLCAYAGGPTPGMRRCGLEVASLDGPLTPALRRRRGWASLVSLAALGMGFAWMFCDRQRLGWHDTISRTCVVEGQKPAS